MRVEDVHSFTDLVRFLETYTSWDDGFAYDPGGIFQLMAALIRNLKANSIDADLSEINGYFEADEKEFFARLSECAQLPEDD
jgi:hypothetical protein